MKKVVSFLSILTLLAHFFAPLGVYAQETLVEEIPTPTPTPLPLEEPEQESPLTPSVSTDKPDYSPHESVVLTGNNFPANSDLFIKVIWPDGISRDSMGVQDRQDQVKADENGNFVFSYDLRGEGIEGNYKVEVLMGTEVLAETSFTDCWKCCKPTPTPEPKGSIRVCKVIIDAGGKIVDGSEIAGAHFTILGITPNPPTLAVAPAGQIPNTVFSTPLTLNTDLFNGQHEGNEAQCVTYSNLKLGGYYYDKEIYPAEGWEAPKYNDQFDTPVSDLSKFFAYSGELFDSNPGNDGRRNLDADGHIVLTKEKPNRTLVILNQYKLEEKPFCGNNIKEEGEECDGTDGVGENQYCSQECKLIEEPEKPELKLVLTKQNNASGEISSLPATVTFEIRVTNESTVKLGSVIIKDAQPGGFSYVPSSSKLDGSPITDPTLNSGVLEWLIGNLEVGESKTLSYQVEISSEVALGTHKNIAVASGVYTDGDCDLAETFIDLLIGVKAACQDVESKVVEESNTAESSVTIAKSLAYGGSIPAPQVLGAAIELPATGSDTNLTLLFLGLGILGFTLRIGAYIYENKKYPKAIRKLAKEVIFTSVVIVLALGANVNQVLAVAPMVTISSLPEYVTTNNFKLSYSALADDLSSIKVRFFVKEDGGSYVAFGSELTGASGWIQVGGGEVKEQNKKYYFKAEMSSLGKSASAETSTTYDTTGPGPVSEYKKERVEPGVYKISWKNPGDSDFSRVFIYRGTEPGFDADGSHKIGERGGAKDQEMSFEDIGLDSNKEYYYVLRALDKAGNSSGLVGDRPSAIVITPTPTSPDSIGVQLGTQVSVPEEEKNGGILGDEKENQEKDKDTDKEEVETDGQLDTLFGRLSPAGRLVLGVGIVILAYVGYKLFFAGGKELPKTKKK